MRIRSRWVLGLCGLAALVPAGSSARAQMPMANAPGAAAVAPSPGGPPVIPLQQVPDSATPASGMLPTWGGPSTGASSTPGPGPGALPAATAGPMTASAPVGEAAGHHHHGILGRRHCVECQRARVKALDGVDVPPPPGYPGGPTMAAGETIISGPVVVSEHVVGSAGPNAPGFAVVGGPGDAAGFAVVNGGAPASEPTPIGVARGGHAPMADPRMAAAMAPRPGAGSFDPSVMQTRVPPPPAAMPGPGHNRPHIVSHMLHIPVVSKRHEERVDRRRETHAMEAYGPANEKVNELPASAVYGRR